MTIEVVILAQGTQQRLGMQHGYKQLLPLPACADAPILERIVRQVAVIFPEAQVTIVGWHTMLFDFENAFRHSLNHRRHHWINLELTDPGNSSLKGIARYLESRVRPVSPESTVVLLGDVVYSWACLRAIRALAETSGFVGTQDLSGHGGELWGVAWSAAADDPMMLRLRDALTRHPQFEEYQPGQLRRWISGMRRGDLMEHVDGMRRSGQYIDIDDYTRDIDVPKHVALLPALSIAARDDDAQHGLAWEIL